MDRFLRGQVEEIVQDPTLRRYGAALALVNSLTATYWFLGFPLTKLLGGGMAPVCWPFADNCQAFRIEGPLLVTLVLAILFLGGIANALCFLSERRSRFGVWLLAGLTVVKTLVIFQDYRLILNQHYMASWVVLTFLFVPHKRRTIPYLIGLFYLWAGTLKLNGDWISGLGLYGLRPLGMPQSWVPAACAYVIVLELGVVFGLFAARPWIFWAALGQFVLFHISSFWIVGFFYPLLMFLLLSMFPMCRVARSGAVTSRGQLSTLFQGKERLATYGVLILFSLAQLYPLRFPGDRALTGEGRMFALHMFDAPVECRASIRLGSGAQQGRILPIRPPFAVARVACDPLLYLSVARDFCNSGRQRFQTDDFDLSLSSRRSGRADFVDVIAIRSFCAAKPAYSLLWHNDWIHGERTMDIGVPSPVFGRSGG